jgi:hypothetical protein
MPLMDEVLENRTIGRIAGAFQRPPHRINRIHEADAEIIDLGAGAPDRLSSDGEDPGRAPRSKIRQLRHGHERRPHPH